MEFDTGIAPHYGAALEVDVSTAMALRLQLEQFSATMDNKFTGRELDIHYRLTSLGMLFRF